MSKTLLERIDEALFRFVHERLFERYQKHFPRHNKYHFLRVTTAVKSIVLAGMLITSLVLREWILTGMALVLLSAEMVFLFHLSKPAIAAQDELLARVRQHGMKGRIAYQLHLAHEFVKTMAARRIFGIGFGIVLFSTLVPFMVIEAVILPSPLDFIQNCCLIIVHTLIVVEAYVFLVDDSGKPPKKKKKESKVKSMTAIAERAWQRLKDAVPQPQPLPLPTN